MITYDLEFQKLREDFEKGKILITDLTKEQMEKFINYYKKEIETNKMDIAITDRKIKDLKKKIDDLV